MSHKALVTFVAQKRHEGMNDEKIRALLVEKEWREDLVDAALAGEKFEDEPSMEAPTPSATQMNTPSYPSPFDRVEMAWAVLAERFAAFALISITMGLFMILAVFIAMLAYTLTGGSLDDIQNLMNSGHSAYLAQTQEAKDAFGGMIKTFFYSNMLAAMMSVLVFAAVMIPVGFFAGSARMVIAVEEAAPTAEIAARKALKLLPGYAWVCILSALVMIGGFFLFVIPGIIAAIGLSFSGYAYFVEGKHGTLALKRSWEIVRSNFLTIIGHGIFVGFVASIASALVGALSNFADQLMSTFIVGPMVVIYFYGLYRDLAAKTDKK